MMDREQDLNFSEILGLFYSIRLFHKYSSDEEYMTYDEWKTMLAGDFIPGRLREYITSSRIPDKEEYEHVS